jgi:hypothetical protein
MSGPDWHRLINRLSERNRGSEITRAGRCCICTKPLKVAFADTASLGGPFGLQYEAREARAFSLTASRNVTSIRACLIIAQKFG